MDLKLDKIDREIITELQKNARIPLKTLAEKVFLSSPAVAARIERLEKNGILTGFHAEVDLFKLGYRIQAFVEVEVEPAQKPEFYPYIQAIPNVLECHCVTGSFSMLLKVVFPGTVELDTFIGGLQRFGRTSTQIVFSTSVKHRGVSVMQPETVAEQT